MKHEYDFQDRMAIGKANAERARSRGQHSGKSAKGWDRKRSDAGPIEVQSWGHVLSSAKIAWNGAHADAIEQFRFDVHGEQWEGL